MTCGERSRTVNAVWYSRGTFPFRNVLLLAVLLLLAAGLSAAAGLPPAGAAAPVAEATGGLAPAVEPSSAETLISPQACSAEFPFRTVITPSRDSYVHSGSAATNYGTSPSLRVGYISAGPFVGSYLTLAAFDLSALPADAVILTATLELYETASATIVTNLRALVDTWTETGVTWDNRPNYSETELATALTPDGSWRRWDLTSMTKKWWSGTLANHGVRLAFVSGTSTSTRNFSSREGANPPRLVVEYVRRTTLTPAADTYVSQNSPTSNYGGAITAYMRDGSANMALHSLVRFNLSTIPAGSSVISASLRLVPYFAREPEAPQAVSVDPRAATASWKEDQVTWNTRPGSASRGDPAGVWSETTGIRLDVSNTVRDWSSGVLGNNGFKLEAAVGTTGVAQFYTREYGTMNAPQLIVTYGLPPCYAATSATINGAVVGVTIQEYSYSASVLPGNVTPPLTYSWTATGQAPVSGSSSVNYTWATPGVKTITVTVENCGSSVVDTHQVTINAPPPTCDYPITGLTLSGPAYGILGSEYIFSAVSSPANATLPITYTWQATGQNVIEIVGGVSAGVGLTWNTLGTKTVSVTAKNCGGEIQQQLTFDVVPYDQLPDLVISSAWYDNVELRVYYVIQNTGGMPIPAGHTVALFKDDVVVDTFVFAEALAPRAVRAGSFAYTWSCAGATAPVKICSDHTGEIEEQNEANNCWQANWSCDLVPPQITSGPTVSGIAEHGANISWTTNEPCRSRLDYGRNGAFNSQWLIDDTLRTNHTASLTGLVAGSTYWFKVTVSDGAGNLETSGDRWFETAPPGSDPPEIVSIGLVEYPSSLYEFYLLQATLADTTYVDRVTFFLDGKSMGRDYTPDALAGGDPDEGLYQVYVSPAALGLSRADWFKAHTLQVQAYNLEGDVTAEVAVVTPPFRRMATRTVVQRLAPSNTIYIGSQTAPSGTNVTVTVWAAEYRWGCYSEWIETPPPGLEGVDCLDVRQDVQFVRIYLDGVEKSTYSMPPGELTHDFVVDLAGKGLGAHTIKAVATSSDGAVAEHEKTVTLLMGLNCVEVTRQVNRVGNYFEITLTVKNVCPTTVHLDSISDRGLVGFYPADRSFGANYTVATSYGPVTQRATVEIDVSAGPQSYLSLNQNAQITLKYVAVPVMHDQEYAGNDLSYSIGYEQGGLVTYMLGANTDTKVERAYYLPWIGSAVDALASANYLLVTNSGRLYGTQPSADNAAVLASMARLAHLKNGALGFLTTYDNGSTLDELIGSGGAWAQRLHPDFRAYEAKGYALIVGDTAIVPTLGAGYTVPYSDLRYASTSGEAKPELALGRIPGSTSAELTTGLRNSIGVHEGWPGYTFDRLRALVSSGRGGGADTFRDHAKEIVARLNHADVTRLNWQNYATPAAMLAVFEPEMAQGNGLVVYRGHAGATSWGDDGPVNLWTSDVAALDFAGYSPFVYALACDSGNYRDHYSMAEAFLRYGAGAYVGAVSPSDRATNGRAGRAFFNRWGDDSSMNVGYAFADMKRDHWNDDSNWNESIYQYLLFGDPKFGSLPVGGREATLEPQVPAGSESLTVIVPDFVVTVSDDGLHRVELPDGSTWLREGEPEVPYWKTSYAYPEGQRIQSVALTLQGGLVVTTGLYLPTATLEPDLDRAAPASVVGATETAWVPDVPQPYAWSVSENSDGSSTLDLLIYPFYYDPATTDLRFYREFGFEVETVPTTVEIESLRTDQATYHLGDEVAIEWLLRNTGDAQDVLVSAVIRSIERDEAVAGLPLRMLHTFTETALVGLTWDSSGVAPGVYYVDLSLLNAAGKLLDEEMRDFQLGVATVEVTSLSAAPTLFQPGDPIQLSMGIRNSGELPVSGTAYIRIVGTGALTYTQEFNRPVSTLSPGATTAFDVEWDTTGVPKGDYRVVAYVLHGPMGSQSREVRVGTTARVYLPMVIRN
jgi:hypothetical protein